MASAQSCADPDMTQALQDARQRAALREVPSQQAPSSPLRTSQPQHAVETAAESRSSGAS